MKQTLFRYKVGLAVIGLLVVSLFVLVTVQAGAYKQDTATAKSVLDVEDKLNTYVTTNYAPPKNLRDAGVSRVPDNITYQLVNTSSYQLCANYKQSSTGFNTADVTSTLVTGSSLSSSATDSNYTTSDGYLYAPTNHHKGLNCYMVKIPDYNSSNGSDQSSCNYDYTNPDYAAADKAYQACLDTQSSSSGYNTTITN